MKFLENELRKAKELLGKIVSLEGKSNGLTDFMYQQQLQKDEDQEQQDDIQEENQEGLLYDKYEEYIDPFEEDMNENNYFGTATCQVFDSSLNSFLFKFTNSELTESHTNESSRYFLVDPNASRPFSGLLMLPDKEYAIFLVKKVIDFLGREYFFIYPEEFFIKLNETYDSFNDRDPVWLCYLLVVLAVGEQYLNESSDGNTPGMRFFSSAMQIYRNYYEQPTLEFIQTLLLFAFYQQGLNRYNSAFSFYGLALRNSLMMGLHRRPTDLNLTPQEKEKRKRVWWTTFVIDSVWSAKLGQPIHVSLNDTDVELPNTNPVSLNDEFDSEVLEQNVKLGVILGNIMRKVYRNNGRKGINLKSIIECLDELDALQRSLPSRIKNSLFKSNNRSAANLYLRLNQAVIITTRPLVLSIFKGSYGDNAVTRRVIQKCTIAAKTSIDILVNLKNNDWFSTFGFWDAQYCFSSLLILIMSSLSGYKFPQIEFGRQINSFMKDAGNFTALENDMRLKELDMLLEKVREQKLRMQQQQQQQQQRHLQTSGNKNIHGTEDNGPQTHIINEKNNEKRSPISALMSEISNNFSAHTGTSISPSSTSSSIKQEPNELGLSYQTTQSNLATLSLNSEQQQQQQEANDNGIFNSNLFKNDLSPETWNSLVQNLQFWDSSTFSEVDQKAGDQYLYI